MAAKVSLQVEAPMGAVDVTSLLGKALMKTANIIGPIKQLLTEVIKTADSPMGAKMVDTDDLPEMVPTKIVKAKSPSMRAS